MEQTQEQLLEKKARRRLFDLERYKDPAFRARRAARAKINNKRYYQEQKEERKAAAIAWQKANPDKYDVIRARAVLKFRLRTKYNMTVEQYHKLLVLQGHKCAICKTDDMGRNQKVWCVDHDHGTNEVRGLLCNYCNIALGFARNNPNTLRAMAAYLEGSL